MVEKHTHTIALTTRYFEKDLKFGVEEVSIGRIVICE